MSITFRQDPDALLNSETGEKRSPRTNSGENKL
jgi:hypothetical protein